MAVDPDSLTVSRRPVPWPPDVIGAAYVITRTTSIIRPVANLDRYRSRITCIGAATVIRSTTIIWSTCIGAATVIRSTTIIWSVPRISSISPFTSACTERGGDQNQYQ